MNRASWPANAACSLQPIAIGYFEPRGLVREESLETASLEIQPFKDRPCDPAVEAPYPGFPHHARGWVRGTHLIGRIAGNRQPSRHALARSCQGDRFPAKPATRPSLKSGQAGSIRRATKEVTNVPDYPERSSRKRCRGNLAIARGRLAHCRLNATKRAHHSLRDDNVCRRTSDAVLTSLLLRRIAAKRNRSSIQGRRSCS